MYRDFWPFRDPDSMRPCAREQSACAVADEPRRVQHHRVERHRSDRLNAQPEPRLTRKPPHGHFTSDDVPVVEMSSSVLRDVMLTIGNRPPETGGVLIGPIGEPLKITGYYFDVGASCSGATYSPDTKTINRKRNEEWLPAGLDWNGFIHSHPGGFDRPSAGDISYFKRLLTSSDESVLVAPIVIPEQFRFVPYVVREGQEDRPQYAHLSII